MGKNEKALRSRPRSSAAAHDAIIDVVYEILQEKPMRDLTHVRVIQVM